MNVFDILILALIAVCLAAAFRSGRKTKRSGNGCCSGCSGACAGCTWKNKTE